MQKALNRADSDQRSVQTIFKKNIEGQLDAHMEYTTASFSLIHHQEVLQG